jgi:hypothetical protein
MAQPGAETYNLIATYPNLEAARQAMGALERAGIEATHISLLGRSAEEAAAESVVDTNIADKRVSRDVSKGTVTGAAVGGAAGGLAGFLAGAAAFAIPGVGPVVGTGIWVATFGGALFGSGVGGVIGGISRINMSDDWDLTYQNALREGKVLLAVHTDDRTELDRARMALAGTSPLDLREFPGAGQRPSDTPDDAGNRRGV